MQNNASLATEAKVKDHVLVVDDDPQVSSMLVSYLKKQGFEVTHASSAKEMREFMSGICPDLCLLDIGLPDDDGFEVMREIRRSRDLPVILLTIRNDTFDRVLGLEFGADDYVTKPFEPRELVARIRTVLRRTRKVPREISLEGKEEIYQFGPWIINVTCRTVIHKDTLEDAYLTSMEFNLLHVMVRNPARVYSRDQLLNEAHGPTAYVGDRAIDVHIMRLRKKIEKDPGHPEYLKTVHGAGYCFAGHLETVK